MHEEILAETEKHMKGAVESSRNECRKIRTGRANTAILDGVDVSCYGGNSPLNHVANLSVPEPRTIVIQPFDRSLIKAIETAIVKADLGLNPNNDGAVIRLAIPALTEERRRELVKVVKKLGEEGKISIRAHRHKANDLIKKHQKNGDIPEDVAHHMTDEVQKMTDQYSKEIDDLLAEKEAEIMEI